MAGYLMRDYPLVTARTKKGRKARKEKKTAHFCSIIAGYEIFINICIIDAVVQHGTCLFWGFCVCIKVLYYFS